jgi:hypothetical protein
MFRLHAFSRTPFTVSMMATGDSTVFPVLLTVIVNVAVPPDDTVCSFGVLSTRIAGSWAETPMIINAIRRIPAAYHFVRLILTTLPILGPS